MGRFQQEGRWERRSDWTIAPQVRLIAPQPRIIAPHDRIIAPHPRTIAPHGRLIAPDRSTSARPNLKQKR